MINIEQLIPIIIAAIFPLILGIIVGAIVKVALKYFLLTLAVLAIAPYFGYEKLPTIFEAIDLAREGFGLGKSFWGFIPIHSAAFIVGVALGFWKA